ncbi:MAG: hypothetical protein KAW88_04695 [Candidatus Cloacimonetes bacterium]|nr:hypothetical protein [Candidatus Cloacimonadota bacterium]
MKKIILFIIIVICSNLSAIDLNLPFSAIQNATSSLVLIYPSPSSSAVNPALHCSGVETSATYLFGIKDIPFYNFHSGLIYKDFGFYLGNSIIEHPLYKESSSNLGLSYKHRFYSIGLGLRYLYNKVENYHKDSSLIVDWGFSWKNKNITTGLSIRNVSQSSFLEAKLPVVYLWETSFEISKDSRFALGFEKEDGFDFSFKFASRYDIFKMMSILASYQYEPDRLGIGIVFNISKMNVVYSIRTHQYLDLTHYISVGYAFKK